jgi:hypothetical protein
MATFPTYAVLLRDGFKVRRNSAVTRTEFEDGFTKQQKRWSRVLVSRDVVYGFSTKANYLAFLTWFNVDINRGASWFDWPDPTTGIVIQARIASGALEEEVPFEPTLEKWSIKFVIEAWDA